MKLEWERGSRTFRPTKVPIDLRASEESCPQYIDLSPH